MEFNSAYSRSEFVKFLEVNFLPQDFTKENTPVHITTKTNYIQEAVKLGVCESLDLVVYEVKHSGKHDPRVGLSKESFKLLAQEWQSKALIAFVPMDSDANYRFSYISIDLDITEQGKIKKSFSNPRRYSYYLGKNIAVYTPNKYLNSGRVTTPEDLQNRFSVEVLTKAFYNELSHWYAWAIDVVVFPGEQEFQDNDKRIEHKSKNVIRLLTRLLFVWFLKQKKLIPSELFNEKDLSEKILKNFNPNRKDGIFEHKSLDSVYYKAILQNLFFATLNCPITPQSAEDKRERGFRKKDHWGQDFGYDYLMRYEDLFSNPEEFVRLVNERVPFLNGGLFDCLDDKQNKVYIDGFSDNLLKPNRLIVPDCLFFGEVDGKHKDLSGYFNDKKKKSVNVLGLLDILKQYNFTIEENTPFDQDVSLDPELLGKVFENLLASYNPETKTTARKQTGSFYTPREIVQYMVDESLIAHLKRTVGEEHEAEYRKLMQYTDDYTNPNEELKRSIIQSLQNCKVLDPACGSGAFPVGVLQQMVHILSQLDPKNDTWKDLILENSIRELGTTLKDCTPEERKEIQEDINRNFDDSITRPDYARKLYLIENCIYGVDIQSIAVQISKLRFFISLVVDQKPTSDAKTNFGIRPLPNLEAKFVAANTLIGLNKGERNLFDNREIEKLQAKLIQASHRIFGAKSNKAKNKYKARVEELQQQITDKLLASGDVGNADARLMREWRMFDQNASSPFFDPEWMFGVSDGFDIVIGNPPYGAKFNAEEKKYFKNNYKHQNYQPESYLFFIEKGFVLSSEEGVLSYIIPNTWLTNLKLTNIRKHIFSSKSILSISHYHKSVFDAVVDTEVFIIRNSFVDANVATVFSHKSNTLVDKFVHNQNKWRAANGEPVNIFTTPQIDIIINKIESYSVKLNSLVDIYAGLVPYEEGKGSPTQTRDMMKARVYNSTYKVDDSYRKAIRGGDIGKYSNNWEGNRWLKYGSNLAAPRKSIIFDNDKLIVRQTGDSIIATFDNEKFVCFKNTHVINAKEGTNLLYILALLNSTLITYYFQYLNPETGEALAEVKKETVEKLRIKTADNQQPFIDAVEQIMAVKSNDSQTDTTALEAEIDQMVYKLYNLTEEEIAIIENI